MFQMSNVEIKAYWIDQYNENDTITEFSVETNIPTKDIISTFWEHNIITISYIIVEDGKTNVRVSCNKEDFFTMVDIINSYFSKGSRIALQNNKDC